MKHTTIYLAAGLLLAGCASTQAPAPAASDLSPTPSVAQVLSRSEGACPVWIYRTATLFHSLTLEKPFVYVNEAQIGTIATGQTFCLNLKEGKYAVSIREPLFFMPGVTSGTVVVEVKPGAPTQYIRYSKEMGGIIPVGGTVSVTSRSDLQMADQAAWQQRR